MDDSQLTPRPVDPGVRIGHVHLKVADLQRALDFYCGVLGFEPTFSRPGAAFISAGGYHHHLGTNTWAAGRPSAGADEARLLDWQIVLPDADSVGAAHAHMVERGYGATPATGGWAFRDPWGTQFTLVSAG